MFTEDEFGRWLRRPEKSFAENLQFGLKAWRAVEFTSSSKYGIILSWVAEEALEKPKQELPTKELIELLEIKAQPGLVAQKIKRDFVQVILKICSESWTEIGQCGIIPELLYKLAEFELLQDLFRSDYEVILKVHEAIFKQYASYLRQFVVDRSALQLERESSFFLLVTNSLKDSAKRAGNAEHYERLYTTLVLQPFVEVLLVLRKLDMCFFEELLALERLLCEAYTEEVLLERVLKQPRHVRLLVLECAIINRRSVERFLKLLLQHVFKEVLEEERQKQPALALTVAAYTLEMLRKHEVSLNFNMTANQSAMAFLGKQLLPCVQQSKESHLKQVLMLLCATLRFNPLILEQHIYQMATWMIVTAKSSDPVEQQLFEQFLVQLLDVFRRLSRAEKFVTNLLKTIKEWLENYPLPPMNDKRKRKISHMDTTNTPTKKKQKLDLSTKAPETSSSADACDFFLEILFKDFSKRPEAAQISDDCTSNKNSFPELQALWPSRAVGQAFSRLITGLVSKPSLVIWKTLLYSLKEVLQLAAHKKLDENLLFQLDLHGAMLCQYFAGSRLAEQSDKFCLEISKQRDLTTNVLSDFGKLVLGREHNKRLMSAFLECCFYAGSFELLLVYYRPDNSMEMGELSESRLLDNLHGCISAEEWTLIQQRLLNFGKSSCRFMYNRLVLQRIQAQVLFNSKHEEPKVSLRKPLLIPLSSDKDQLKLLLSSPTVKWVVANLSREEKLQIVSESISKPEYLDVFTDDMESVELLAITVYQRLHKAFPSSQLGSLPIKFDVLFQGLDEKSAKALIKELVDVLKNCEGKSKCFQPPVDASRQALDVLQKLPIAFLNRELKTVLFILHLAFYDDLRKAESDVVSQEAFKILKEMLHFGPHVRIFKHFTTESMLELLPVESCWEFYEFLFGAIRNEEKGTENFLNSLTEILKKQKLTNDDRRLLLLAIDTLATITGPAAKRQRKHLDVLLDIYADYVEAHFNKTSQQDAVSRKDKKFVEKTLPGFAHYATSVLKKASLPGQKPEDTKTCVNENFRRICKLYIGHSMDYRNPHAIRLVQLALNQRQKLHLDLDEIEFVLSTLWQQLKADLRSQQPLHTKSMEVVVRMIISNKTNEDFLLTLNDTAASMQTEDYVNVIRLLNLMAKVPLSTIKAAIFNEQFKQITANIRFHMERNERQQLTDEKVVLSLLTCQQAFVENKMIPMSIDTLDGILDELIDINIKKFALSDANQRHFYALHLAMTELCTALIKQRHVLLVDRIPQFMHVFKDLVQSVVAYKSDRLKGSPLAAEELDELAELALKLETLSHVIASHSVAVKRVAPFVLTFVISLMVSSKRPTTLYPQIKTHIESICYDLIGICDHRVGRFILRCSNEAARQLYELLVKDHQKYHKFKGKV